MIVHSLEIYLDSSVKHISQVACYHLSGIIENGIVLAADPDSRVVIYKDKIDFGQCVNPELSEVSGNIMFNFYKEYGHIVYHFPDTVKCGLVSKTIEYDGVLAPDSPDNQDIYNMIYPKFG